MDDNSANNSEKFSLTTGITPVKDKPQQFWFNLQQYAEEVSYGQIVIEVIVHNGIIQYGIIDTVKKRL